MLGIDSGPHAWPGKCSTTKLVPIACFNFQKDFTKLCMLAHITVGFACNPANIFFISLSKLGVVDAATFSEGRLIGGVLTPYP